MFTIEAFANAFDRRTGKGDDCGKWLLRSPPTDAASLEDVPTEGWMIWTEDGVTEPSHFSISCDECNRPVDCSYHGTCDSDTNQCNCDPTRLGNRCNIPQPCDTIRIVYLGDTSYDYGTRGRYDLLLIDGTLGPFQSRERTKLLYGRPVYVNLVGGNSINETATNDGFVDFLYYTGSRWAVATWNINDFLFGFFPSWPIWQDNQIPHGFWDDLTLSNPFAISEVTNSGSPTGLRWRQVLESRSRGNFGHYGATYPFKFGVYCETCDEQIPNVCGSFGSCTDGSCECTSCFGGHYCEYSLDDNYVSDLSFDLNVRGYDNITESFGLSNLEYADQFLSPGLCYNDPQ